MRRAIRGALLALALTAAGAPAASADFGFQPGSVRVQPVDAGGQPESRAGVHPDRLLVDFAFATTPAGELEGNPQDVVVDLPAGLSGDPTATPRCSRAAFLLFACPLETQVGRATVSFAGFGRETLPIYNIETEPDGLGEFGFIVLIVPVRLQAGLRSDGDHGLRVQMSDVLQEVPLQSASIELWGVPADHQTGTPIPRRGFLTTPTRCDGALTSAVRVRTWQRPDRWLTETASTGGPQVGCDRLALAPRAEVVPTTTAANTPTGMRIAIDVPQSDDPDRPVTPHISEVVVALPDGYSLSPGVAHGLVPCADAEMELGSALPPHCPEGSRIGTVEIASPSLPQPLRGGVFIASSGPGEPFRLFVTAQGPNFTLKLRGSLRLDEVADRLVATVGDLPQLPFSRIVLTFKDGPRAPFATPLTCRTSTAVVSLASYAGGAPASTGSTIVGSGPGGGPCPAAQPFAPTVTAGVSPATAGADSTLSLRIARRDEDQTLDRVTFQLPRGVTARLADVARCAAALAAAGACPPASRIGAVTAWAGAGATPLPVTGEAYLTGPYRGARLGLALVLHANVGPFDLGVAVVRASLDVDASDAHLTVETDRLPQTLGGVALRLQALRIDVDRPGFLVNPTSCDPAQIDTLLTANGGATAQLATRFGLRGCRRLPFGFTARVGPRGGTARKPGLRIALRLRAGGANLRGVSVQLPRLLRFDAKSVDDVCGRGEARAGRCPAATRVGQASAHTPLLRERLSGPIHVVAGEDPDDMPGLWTTLEGDGLRLVLESRTTLGPAGRVRSTFGDLPDVPLSAFQLRLRGGDGGLLRAVAGRCGRSGRAARVTAQSQSGLERSRIVPTRRWRRCA